MARILVNPAILTHPRSPGPFQGPGAVAQSAEPFAASDANA